MILGWKTTAKPSRAAPNRNRPRPVGGSSSAWGYRQDTQYFQNETYETTEISLNPGLTIPVYAPYVQMNFDIQMGVLFGDMPQSFVFESFGLGAQYTFFNKHVVEQIRIVAATGLGMRFISQSYMDVFSMDVYHIRPYITSGPVFEVADFLAISILPYVGIPLYFDTNSDNDPDLPRRHAPPHPAPRAHPAIRPTREGARPSTRFRTTARTIPPFHPIAARTTSGTKAPAASTTACR